MNITFFDKSYTVNGGNVVDAAGRHPTDLVIEVLLSWCSSSTCSEKDSSLISFRDIPEGGPLAVNFANNTNKTLTQSFSGQLSKLTVACRRLGARPANLDLSAEFSARFEALPGIPIYLVFNDKEDALPAQCHLFLEESAASRLPPRALFAIGTYLTGRLIGEQT
jgi:uncharacterized protein DUF3786